MEVQITRTTPVYRSPEKTGIFVQWTVSSPPAAGIDKFKLERSGSPEGPFELVIDNIGDFHFFDDLRAAPVPADEDTRENLNFLSLSRAVYYRLTVTDADGNEDTQTRVVGPDNLSRKIMLLRRKAQRDLGVSFKFNSIDLAILKRRHWGLRCRDCFDVLTKKVTKSKCNTCYGTGFEDGYFTPVRVRGRIGVQNVVTNITPQGKSDVNQKRLTLLDYPELEVDDIVVDVRQNKRYIVKHRHATELQTVAVHQQLTVSELARDSVEHRIPVNLDHSPQIY
jgi:hypothetical protein